MAWWLNQPNTYKYHGFIDIPEGNHRVRICKVEVERFTNKRKCFEITLEVSGYHGKLWYHLWYDPEKMDQYKKDFYPFFCSFKIEEHDLSQYKKWVGAYGAVNVSYDYRKNEFEAKYLRCLYGQEESELPPWKDTIPNPCTELFREIPF